MRHATHRLSAALLVALLLTAPALAAPVAPDPGQEAAVGSSIFQGFWLDVSRWWNDLVTVFVAADSSNDPPSGTTEGTGNFDPDGLTALPPDVGGEDGPVTPLL
jgi:hypothetical protein